MQSDEHFMKMALDEAKSALESGEVPVGAVITMEGRVLAKAHNSP
ncbi:MAG: deaminase, partial [Thermodesulfobacteriota bacterium]|nr:deaminase [Thermodesulfobacteriota bacterium]